MTKPSFFTEESLLVATRLQNFELLKLTSSGTGGSGGGNVGGYSQAWLRGEGPAAHVHEGIRRADGSGWVAIGDTLPEDDGPYKPQVH